MFSSNHYFKKVLCIHDRLFITIIILIITTATNNLLMPVTQQFSNCLANNIRAVFAKELLCYKHLNNSVISINEEKTELHLILWVSAKMLICEFSVYYNRWNPFISECIAIICPKKKTWKMEKYSNIWDKF